MYIHDFFWLSCFQPQSNQILSSRYNHVKNPMSIQNTTAVIGAIKILEFNIYGLLKFHYKYPFFDIKIPSKPLHLVSTLFCLFRI